MRIRGFHCQRCDVWMWPSLLYRWCIPCREAHAEFERMEWAAHGYIRPSATEHVLHE